MQVKIVDYPSRSHSVDTFHREEEGSLEVGGDINGHDHDDRDGCNMRICTSGLQVTLFLENEDQAVSLVDAMHQVAYILVAKRDARNANKAKPVEVPGISTTDKSEPAKLLEAIDGIKVGDVVECVDDELISLTKGETYEVASVEGNYITLFGINAEYRVSRFRKPAPARVQQFIQDGRDSAAPMGSAANRQANREVLEEIETGTAGA